MRDFTIITYKQLLEVLLESKYALSTVTDFINNSQDNTIILRHDVDRRKYNALALAKIQYSKAIRGTYYFRMVPESYDEEVIKKIAAMGHEIGYHYETMDKINGDIEEAYQLFNSELVQLRKITPVKTACMHGSPLSSYDNRDLWKYFDYRELGIESEPYFDIDFDEVYYLTDTGRRWDGKNVSVRDYEWNPDSSEYIVPVRTKALNKKFIKEKFHSTFDIIEGILNDNLSGNIMMNFHPHRWHDNERDWWQELVFQNVKNIIKRAVKVKG